MRNFKIDAKTLDVMAFIFNLTFLFDVKCSYIPKRGFLLWYSKSLNKKLMKWIGTLKYDYIFA